MLKPLYTRTTHRKSGYGHNGTKNGSQYTRSSEKVDVLSVQIRRVSAHIASGADSENGKAVHLNMNRLRSPPLGGGYQSALKVSQHFSGFKAPAIRSSLLDYPIYPDSW